MRNLNFFMMAFLVLTVFGCKKADYATAETVDSTAVAATTDLIEEENYIPETNTESYAAMEENPFESCLLYTSPSPRD